MPITETPTAMAIEEIYLLSRLLEYSNDGLHRLLPPELSRQLDAVFLYNKELAEKYFLLAYTQIILKYGGVEGHKKFLSFIDLFLYSLVRHQPEGDAKVIVMARKLISHIAGVPALKHYVEIIYADLDQQNEKPQLYYASILGKRVRDISSRIKAVEI